MSWTFLWMMLALKIPIAALIYLVWWAIRQEPEVAADDDNIPVGREPRRHPRPPRPRRPRRGPNHGGGAPLAPPRVRTLRARARQLER